MDDRVRVTKDYIAKREWKEEHLESRKKATEQP
jgi:hypothetical protein